MNQFIDRMIRAAKLDVHLFEEGEKDKDALKQAVGVVVLSSIAAGIGLGSYGISGFFWGASLALIGWAIWAYLAYLIGTKILPEPQTHADIGELLRTTGFSSSPGIIRVLGIIPGLGQLVFSVAFIWMLVSFVIALRQALDYQSTFRAVGVCLIGWLVQILIIAFFLAFLGSQTTGV